jgi:hypothetical protein
MDHGSILSPEYLSQDLTQISMSETAPLNPAIASDTDLENEDLCDLQETEGQKKNERGPLYILIMYGLSFIISVRGLELYSGDMELLSRCRLMSRVKKTKRRAMRSTFGGCRALLFWCYLPHELQMVLYLDSLLLLCS